MSASEKHLLLRNPDLRLIWMAQALSQTGNRVFQIAVIWWIVTQQNGVAPGTFTALFLVCCALPAVVLAKPIGSVLDRVSSKRVMTTAARAVSLLLALAAVLYSFGLFSVLVVLATGLALATSQAFYDPGLNRGLGDLVEKRDIPSAIAIVSSTQSLANFGGAVLGAFLMDAFGMGTLLWITAGLYLTASVLVMLAKFRFAQPAEASGAERSDDSAPVAVLALYPLLKRVLFGFGLVNFFVTPILVVLPLYVRQELNGDAADLGWLEASVWLGLVAGTLSGKSLSRRATPLRTGTFAMATIGLALLFPGLVASRPVYQLSLFIAGAALGINNLRFMALFQETVADRLKGRFFALVSAVVNFTIPVSFLFFGMVGDRISPQWLCLIQGAGVIGLSGYFFLVERSGVPLRAAGTEVRRGA